MIVRKCSADRIFELPNYISRGISYGIFLVRFECFDVNIGSSKCDLMLSVVLLVFECGHKVDLLSSVTRDI